MLRVRRSVPGFRKRPYPASLVGKRIRSREAEQFMWAYTRFLWLLVSPLVLLVQAFPQRDAWARVTLPGDDAS
jgi:hypothetical protein